MPWAAKTGCFAGLGRRGVTRGRVIERFGGCSSGRSLPAKNGGTKSGSNAGVQSRPAAGLFLHSTLWAKCPAGSFVSGHGGIKALLLPAVLPACFGLLQYPSVPFGRLAAKPFFGCLRGLLVKVPSFVLLLQKRAGQADALPLTKRPCALRPLPGGMMICVELWDTAAAVMPPRY